jgi:dienelactone hydrolase
MASDTEEALMLGTDEKVELGVAERRFEIESGGEAVPGILWRPEHATGPTPLVLLGHGGTQHKRAVNVLGLARRFVRHLGYTAVAIDAPGHGERVTDESAAEAARVELERRITTQGGAGSERPQVSSQALRVFTDLERAASDWTATLDALEAQGDLIDARIGYWGLSMGTVIGLPFVASDPRVTAAVLGLAGLSGLPGAAEREAAARRLTIPVLFVFQWDDQLMTRESGLGLFDAIGSSDKAMHVFPGGHIDTPLYERDAYDAFFERHLGR